MSKLTYAELERQVKIRANMGVRWHGITDRNALGAFIENTMEADYDMREVRKVMLEGMVDEWLEHLGSFVRYWRDCEIGGWHGEFDTDIELGPTFEANAKSITKLVYQHPRFRTFVRTMNKVNSAKGRKLVAKIIQDIIDLEEVKTQILHPQFLPELDKFLAPFEDATEVNEIVQAAMIYPGFARITRSEQGREKLDEAIRLYLRPRPDPRGGEEYEEVENA
jgi:hypothetical protein